MQILSIKNTPDEIVARLKRWAALNRRSLQGELMAIIEAATTRPEFGRGYESLTPKQLLTKIRSLGISPLRPAPTSSAPTATAISNGIESLEVEAEAVLDLAISASLSAYDASDLPIARRYNAELVTHDQKLHTAFVSPIGR
jgi:plasmid stability protein